MVGRSARVLGVNMGHRAHGSNAWHFMARMGVNGARMFLYTTIQCGPPALASGAVKPVPREGCPIAAEAHMLAVWRDSGPPTVAQHDR